MDNEDENPEQTSRRCNASVYADAMHCRKKVIMLLGCPFRCLDSCFGEANGNISVDKHEGDGRYGDDLIRFWEPLFQGQRLCSSSRSSWWTKIKGSSCNSCSSSCTSPITACRSPRFLVASIWDPPVAVNSSFHASVAALSALVLLPLRAQQFGVLCLTVYVIQLLGLISFEVTWKRICLSDTASRLAH